MPHQTKIAMVVREDLATWQKLNVTAYLASAVAAGRENVIGEAYEDASGGRYLAMFVQPVLVFTDEANRAAVRAVPAERLSLAGLAVHERRSVVDKTLKGLRLHP